jgi:hypothetical protein
VRKFFGVVGILLFGVSLAAAQQNSMRDKGGRVLTLENAWNHALEAKDTKALDMLLANTFVSIDIDGSISSKRLRMSAVTDNSSNMCLTRVETIVLTPGARGIGSQRKGTLGIGQAGGRKWESSSHHASQFCQPSPQR